LADAMKARGQYVRQEATHALSSDHAWTLQGAARR
jgi:hypothetical protein